MKRLLRSVPVLLIRLLGALGAFMAARQARQPLPHRPRILLIRPGNLGDLVMTTPVLRALRAQAPDAHITMLVASWSSEVVARHPDIDQLLTCPFPSSRVNSRNVIKTYLLLLRAARQLRRGNYDIAISLRPRFWWSAALTYLARIPRRVGCAVDLCTPFLTHALPYFPHEHSTATCLRLTSAGLEAVGYQPLKSPYTPERYPFYFKPTAEERQWVTERLKAEGVDATTPVVVIHPGSGGPIKLWRADGWANCITSLVRSQDQSTPVHVVLTGIQKELPLLQEVAKNTPVRVTQVTDATVGQLAALLEHAQLVLGVDSGPLHLAVSQGTPTVQLFGPTDPHNYGPWGNPDEHLVVTATQRCPSCPAIPCGRLHFTQHELADHPCMRMVPEEDLLAAISRLFAHEVALPTIRYLHFKPVRTRSAAKRRSGNLSQPQVARSEQAAMKRYS